MSRGVGSNSGWNHLKEDGVDMGSIRGFYVKQRKGLSHWESLCEEWILANERYCRVMKGEDAPFVYTERALIGILSGAAWRCGRVALEEFQYEKGYKNKPKWNGRADLYMASEGHEELVEAKFKWVSLASKAFCDAAQTVLSIAVEDAKKTRGGPDEMLAVGAAFIAVYLPAKKKDSMEEHIHSAISEISKSSMIHAAAWCFPKEFRHSINENGYYCPGIIMVAANSEYS